MVNEVARGIIQKRAGYVMSILYITNIVMYMSQEEKTRRICIRMLAMVISG